MISGLPESTLRYYEQIGIIAPIAEPKVRAGKWRYWTRRRCVWPQKPKASACSKPMFPLKHCIGVPWRKAMTTKRNDFWRKTTMSSKQ